jgi:hypothetical protein
VLGFPGLPNHLIMAHNGIENDPTLQNVESTEVVKQQLDRLPTARKESLHCGVKIYVIFLSESNI